jgi:hypothetical protein
MGLAYSITSSAGPSSVGTLIAKRFSAVARSGTHADRISPVVEVLPTRGGRATAPTLETPQMGLLFVSLAPIEEAHSWIYQLRTLIA